MSSWNTKFITSLALGWIIVSSAVKVSSNTLLWGLMPYGIQCGWWVLPTVLICLVLLVSILTGGEKYFTERRINLPAVAGGVYAAAGALLILAAGWFLRSRNHFMGDGWAFLSNVRRAFFLREHEPLDFFLHQLLFRALNALGLENSAHAYWLPHLVLLPVYLYILWLLAKLLAEKPPARAAVFAFMATTATTQLFFGYVESYTFANFMLALYFLLALRQVANPSASRLLPPTSVLLLATCFHLSAVIFTPTLLYLWLQAFRRKNNKGLKGFSSLAVFGLIVIAAVFAFVMFDTDLPLPLHSAENRAYTLLSSHNFWDKLNLLTFVAPSAVIVLLMFLLEFNPVVSHRDNITAHRPPASEILSRM